MAKQAQKESREVRPYLIAADLVMIPNKKIRNVDLDKDGKIDGFQFDIANPFYTAEPISSVRSLNVTIDGEKIDSDRMSFVLRDQKIGIKDMLTLYEVPWGFGEVSFVYIEKSGGLKKGSHQVECTLSLRPSAGDYGVGDMQYPTKTVMIVE